VVELITAGRSGHLGIADSSLEMIEAEVVGELALPDHSTDQSRVDIKKTGVDE
jgi:hypothetical protein